MNTIFIDVERYDFPECWVLSRWRHILCVYKGLYPGLISKVRHFLLTNMCCTFISNFPLFLSLKWKCVRKKTDRQKKYPCQCFYLKKKKMQMKTEIFVKTKGLQATVLNVHYNIFKLETNDWVQVQTKQLIKWWQLKLNNEPTLSGIEGQG